MAAALTLTFEETQGARSPGWSETVVLPLTTVADTTSNLAPVGQYIGLRSFMLGSGVQITYAKLTLLTPGRPPVVSVRRQETLLDVPPPQVAPTGGLPYYNFFTRNQPADFSQNVLMLRFFTDPTAFPQYFRTFWIAAIPDVITEIDQLAPLAGAWWNAFKAWRAYMIGIPPNSGVLIQSNDKSNTNPAFVCTAYDPVTGKLTCPGHTLVSGQQAELTGWRAFPGGTVPRGQYKVTVGTDASIILQGAKTFLGIKTLGNIRPLSWVFTALFDFESRSWTNKKKGRPFGELRGRRTTSRTSRA